MTQSFDQVLYSNLLAQVAPQVIETEEEYKRALELAEHFTFAKNLTLEETALYKLLVTLIEVYEAKHYPMDEVKPHEVLRHIVEASGISKADLANLIGSDDDVSDILNGKKFMNETQARAIGERFKVSPSFFIEQAPQV
ncbi:transcriptional regulator [Rivularia sp. IAM M-261]|nr:transcriptional regulator [Rivularia sp. IAM M-261]